MYNGAVSFRPWIERRISGLLQQRLGFLQRESHTQAECQQFIAGWCLDSRKNLVGIGPVQAGGLNTFSRAAETVVSTLSSLVISIYVSKACVFFIRSNNSCVDFFIDQFPILLYSYRCKYIVAGAKTGVK